MKNIHIWLVRNISIVVGNSIIVFKMNVEVILALQEDSQIAVLILCNIIVSLTFTNQLH